jgi:oxygen-independent coproporphyrinogen-3 oxidase
VSRTDIAPVGGLLGRMLRGLTGHAAPLAFEPCGDFDPPPLDAAGLYVHVPFCRSLCPYCPYLRGPYRPADAELFCEALDRETAWYAGRLPGLQAGSVYFGGGTPTTLGPRLAGLVEALRRRFDPRGPWCIETNPADLGRDTVRRLAALGFASVSVGVQSFEPATLAFLGRGYAPARARQALDDLAASGIPAVNLDLMFALPGQDEAAWQRDLDAAIASPATQVTAYPLFTFPYSEVGRRRGLPGVEMPRWRVRRRMYFQLYDALTAAGFRRVSVWSFQRGPGHRFSSVTRSRYLGFGPSGGSCYGPGFTLNTFSLAEYVRATRERGHAVALAMPLSGELDLLMDLYWRAYDTHIPLAQWSEATSQLPRLRAVLRAARVLGLCEAGRDELRLTRRGSFWVHLLQNHLALPGVSALWDAGKREAWPGGVALA